MNKRQQELIEQFKREPFCPQEGEELLAIIRRVSATGMSRTISFYLPRLYKESGVHYWPMSHHMAAILGWRPSKDGDGLIVKGTGMNMVFHAVRSFSIAVFGDSEYLRYKVL